MIKLVCDGYKKEHYWLSIRVFKNIESVPRWHTDGMFFIQNKNPELQSKFIITLKGDPTLFCNLTTDKLESLQQIPHPQSHKNYDIYQKQYNNALKNTKIITHKNTDKYIYGVIFFIEYQLYSAHHSEPTKSNERIFVSISPRTYEQINELKTRWNK